MTFLVSSILVMTWFHAGRVYSTECSRQKSRVVRNILQKGLYQAFHEMSLSVPQTCPLHPDMDCYHDNEMHKHPSSYSRWECGYCGKAFVTENHLDMHFDRRHGRTVKVSPRSVCLADYCDIFRCDAVARRGSHDYWMTALCIEDDMRRLLTRCTNILESCLPLTSKKNSTNFIKHVFLDGVCSFLTCEKYWDTPSPNSELSTMLFVIWSVFILFAILIYYFITCSHFLMEDSMWTNFQPDASHPYVCQPEYAPLRSYETLHQRRVT